MNCLMKIRNYFLLFEVLSIHNLYLYHIFDRSDIQNIQNIASIALIFHRLFMKKERVNNYAMIHPNKFAPPMQLR